MTFKSSSVAATPLRTVGDLAMPGAGGGSPGTWEALDRLGQREADQAFLQAIPAVVVVAHLLKLQNKPAQDVQARQYQEQCLQALRKLGQRWPQEKINAVATRLFYSALKHGTNALSVFTKSLLHELARETANTNRPAQRLADATKSQSPSAVRASTLDPEQGRLLARAQQQLAQFYWKAAGGKAGLAEARDSLKSLKQTASALTALPAQSSSGIKALQSSLPQWLSQAQRYINSVARAGQSARLPQPPVGAASAVQEAASAAAKALRPPGERETIKPARPEPEVGELAELEQRRKYVDKLQEAVDAVSKQWGELPLQRQKKIVAETAARFGIDPDHLARAVQARVSQMTAGVTGGVRASGGEATQVASAQRSGWGWPEAEVAQMLERFQLPHLKVHENGAHSSIAIDTAKMNAFAQERWNGLIQKFGSQNALKLLNALVMGHSNEVGLMALCQAWREIYGSKPLSLDTIFGLGTSTYNNDKEFLHDLVDHLGGNRVDNFGRYGLYPTTVMGELMTKINRGETYVPDQNLRLEVAARKKIDAGQSLNSDSKIVSLVLTRMRKAMEEKFDYRNIKGSAKELYPNSEIWVDALARMTAAGAMIADEIRAEQRSVWPDDPGETWSFYQHVYPEVTRIDVADRYPRYYEWLRRELGAILLNP